MFTPDNIIIIGESIDEVHGGVAHVMSDQLDNFKKYHVVLDVLVFSGIIPQTESKIVSHFNYDNIGEKIDFLVHFPISKNKKISIIVHNIFTMGGNNWLKDIMQELIESYPYNVQIIAWTHDICGPPKQLYSKIKYVTISNRVQHEFANYFGTELPQIIDSSLSIERVLGIGTPALQIIQQRGLDKYTYIAFFPVRLTRNKNIELALEIVKSLNELKKPTALIVPGDFTDYSYSDLYEKCENMGLGENVIFLSKIYGVNVSNQMMADIYKLSSFLLFTSLHEGFGLPIIESGINRLPIVMTRIPTSCDIDKTNSTMTFDPMNESSQLIASNIIKFLDSLQVENLRRHILNYYTFENQLRVLGWNLSKRWIANYSIDNETHILWCPDRPNRNIYVIYNKPKKYRFKCAPLDDSKIRWRIDIKNSNVPSIIQIMDGEEITESDSLTINA